MYLTKDNYTDYLSTGREVTATNLSHEGEPLHLGIGPTAYLYRDDAQRLLSDDEFDAACTYGQSLNPLFVHLDDSTLFHLLRRETFYLSDDED